MKTVLVADEDPVQRQLIDLLLAADQYSIQNFESGREVLEHLRDHTPDLAILDLDLPEIGGADICGKMRKVARLGNIPVVLTAPQQADNRLDEETRRLGRLVRANLVVQKPLGDKNLRTRIKQLLDQASAKSPLLMDRAVRNTLVLEETLDELGPSDEGAAPTSGEVLRLKEQIALLESEKEQLQGQVRSLKAAQGPAKPTDDEVLRLREELAKQKKKIDKLQRRNHLLRESLDQEKNKPRRSFFGRRRD